MSRVQEFKEDLISKAEDLIRNGVPEKIAELTELLATPMFAIGNFNAMHQAGNKKPPTKRGRRKRWHPVPSNEVICRMIELVKPILRILSEDLNLLKMWILLLIPKIEDGNNFGVSVQHQLLAEIVAVEKCTCTFIARISEYFSQRGNMVLKVVEHPEIPDFRRALIELDEQKHVEECKMVSEVRNRYLFLNDVILKNIEKLKMPRISNMTSLY